MDAKQSLALAAASLAAVALGVATLHTQRTSSGTTKSDRPSPAKTGVRVALLRLDVPRDWRDVVRNDVFLDKTVAAVDERLVVFVTGRTRHEAINYMSQLYNLTWDVACLRHKEITLDIRVIAGIADDGVPTWDDLVRLPDLDAVFCGDTTVSADHLNATRNGLEPVAYHSLSEQTLVPYFRDDLHYFENKDTPLKTHSLVMVGGTFDHLHNGHKKLLSLAVSVSDKRLLVGITSDEMLVKKQNANLIESLATREQHVREYVAFLKPSLKVDFAVLADAYGPSIVVEESDAVLVVSTETVAAVPKIQEMRTSRGLTPLEIFLCRRTDASTLSSSYIRDQLAAGSE